MKKFEDTYIFRLQGNCEINRELMVKKWDDKCFISQWKDEYTLSRVPRKGGCSFKISVSESDAKYLIEKLKLNNFKSVVFRSGSTWI